MAGQPSARLIEAMKLVVNAGVTPYKAAQRAGIATETMYRSKLYKAHRDCGGDPAKLAEIRRQLDVTRPIARAPKKPRKFVIGNT